MEAAGRFRVMRWALAATHLGISPMPRIRTTTSLRSGTSPMRNASGDRDQRHDRQHYAGAEPQKGIAERMHARLLHGDQQMAVAERGGVKQVLLVELGPVRSAGGPLRCRCLDQLIPVRRRHKSRRQGRGESIADSDSRSDAERFDVSAQKLPIDAVGGDEVGSRFPSVILGSFSLRNDSGRIQGRLKGSQSGSVGRFVADVVRPSDARRRMAKRSGYSF